MSGARPRQLTPRESPKGVLALIRTAFAGMDGRIDPPSSMHRLTEMEIVRRAEAGEVWVIGGDRDPVACAFVTRQADALLLTRLATHPAHRSRGFARSLIATAASCGCQLGVRTLRLQSRIELTETHAALVALGFRRTGVTAHPGYDRPTSIAMELRIPPQSRSSEGDFR